MRRPLVALLLFSGCAFGITAPDPDRPRSKMPECDTGKGLVVLDATVAAAAGLLALSLLDSEPGIALVPASIGAVYAAGAIKGNASANKCKRAITEYQAYVASRAPSPMPGELRVPRLAAPAPEAPPEPPAAAVASPTPADATVPAAASAPPAPRPAAPVPPATRPADDEWAEFWREVE